MNNMREHCAMVAMFLLAPALACVAFIVCIVAPLAYFADHLFGEE